MSKITRVGVDLAKTVIQVHAVDAAGRVLVRRALKRDMFIDWCVQLPAGCLIAMGPVRAHTTGAANCKPWALMRA